jgi:protein-S-isoprenylcysteine O-methyltransferase Ste14
LASSRLELVSSLIEHGKRGISRVRRLPLSLLAAYTIFGLFIVVESRLRQGEEAKTFEAGAADEGTTRLIGASFGAALVGTPLLSLLGPGRMAMPRIVGPIVMVLSLGLRVWAARVLGRFYTRTLRITSGHVLVHSGPYRLVRHPGYLADLVMWVGFGLASASWLATVGVAAAMAYAYSRRIRSEEAMLVDSLGEPYREYMRTTWRLIPGVY